MLTREEYKFLDELLQTQLLWINGVFLMSRKTERLNVELFSLYDFYVEIFFDLKFDDPLYIKTFDDSNCLDVYLEQINIDDVYERMTGSWLMSITMERDKYTKQDPGWIFLVIIFVLFFIASVSGIILINR